MNITIRFPHEVLPLQVNTTDTIIQLKKKLCELKKMPEPLPFWLTLNNVILTDDSLIHETGIGEGTTILAQNKLSVTFPLPTNKGIAMQKIDIGIAPNTEIVPVASLFSDHEAISNKINVNAPFLTGSILFLTCGVILASGIFSYTFIRVKENKNFHEIAKITIQGGVEGALDKLDSIGKITENIGENLGRGLWSGLFKRK